MREYNIITNPIELFAGTTNTTSPVYTEAVKTIENKSSIQLLDKVKRLSNEELDAEILKLSAN